MVVVAVIAALGGVLVGSNLKNSPGQNASSQSGPLGGLGAQAPAGGPAPGASASGNSGLGGRSPDAIAARVEQSVVDVNTQLTYQDGAGAGTGMVLTSSGYILTNNHVVDGATSVSVTLVQSGRSYRAAVVAEDPSQDIAVIKVDSVDGLVPFPAGNSSSLSTGDGVVAIGNAGGKGGSPSVVAGVVQALNQTITASEQGGGNPEQLSGLIQTNAPIQRGDSGGPLVDAGGKVIGMDTAASQTNQFDSAASIGFAIPINRALKIAGQMEAGVSSATIHIGLPGFLGVQVAASTGTFGGIHVTGAPVSEVIAGTPAARIGLFPGDVITAVDGKTVTTAQALTAILRTHHPGDRVSLAWVAQGRTRSATVQLITGPAD